MASLGYRLPSGSQRNVRSEKQTSLVANPKFGVRIAPSATFAPNFGSGVRVRGTKASVVEHVEQFADGVLAFERVAHRDALDDVVVISTADLLPPEVPGVLEIVEDPLHRTGCDPDHVAEVTLT